MLIASASENYADRLDNGERRRYSQMLTWAQGHKSLKGWLQNH